MVDPRRRKVILGTCLVEVSKINARPSFPIGLLNENNVEKPIWIKHFTDEANLHELVGLLERSFLFCEADVPLLLSGFANL